MSDRSRPIRRDFVPVVGTAYYRDVVVDSPQKTWRCFVLAIDDANKMALCAWDHSMPGSALALWWAPYAELQVEP